MEDEEHFVATHSLAHCDEFFCCGHFEGCSGGDLVGAYFCCLFVQILDVFACWLTDTVDGLEDCRD